MTAWTYFLLRLRYKAIRHVHISFFLLFLWLAFVFACCSLIVIFVDYRRKQRIIPNYYACSRQQKAYKQMGFNWPTARRGGNTLKDWSIFTNQLVHGLLCNLLLGYFHVSPVQWMLYCLHNGTVGTGTHHSMMWRRQNCWSNRSIRNDSWNG